MAASPLQREARGEESARPTVEGGRAPGSERTDDIVPDNGYPPEAMRAFCVMWWAMWLAIFVVWAVRL